jgi:D-serine deaminase-like pyridoxal phosphate-dependent protein
VPSASTIEVGDRLRVVPNHACVTVANHSTLHLVDDATVVDRWPIAPRDW